LKNSTFIKSPQKSLTRKDKRDNFVNIPDDKSS